MVPIIFDKAGIGDYVVITQNGNGGVLDLLKESKMLRIIGWKIAIGQQRII